MRYFGLIGKPLVHSFSQRYFTQKFQEESIDAAYGLYELDKIEDLKQLCQQKSFSGLNVTIPYKQSVLPYLSEFDETARAVGAVNVIKFVRRSGEVVLKGYNSDVIGFHDSLVPLLRPYHKRALVFGTGGASKAVEYVLRRLGIEVQLVSRQAKDSVLSYEQITPEVLQSYQLLVNATPLGTFPHVDTCVDIPYQNITNKHLLYDLVYNPQETLFLRYGKERGAQVMNGYAMLRGQAEAAWEIWNKQE